MASWTNNTNSFTVYDLLRLSVPVTLFEYGIGGPGGELPPYQKWPLY